LQSIILHQMVMFLSRLHIGITLGSGVRISSGAPAKTGASSNSAPANLPRKPPGADYGQIDLKVAGANRDRHSASDC
jgi:hypothetical protein